MARSAPRSISGLLDTNIMILRKWIIPEELPAEMAITAITLAELSAGPHQVHSNAEQRRPRSHPRNTCALTASSSSPPAPSRGRWRDSTTPRSDTFTQVNTVSNHGLVPVLAVLVWALTLPDALAQG
jgi:hypothetical protein